MATITYTCKVCTVTTTNKEDDFWTENQSSPDNLDSIDEPWITGALGPNRHTVCEKCARKMEQRFSRPASAGNRTLGDAIIRSIDLFYKVLGADFDRGTQELFPEAAERITTEAKRRMERFDDDLCFMLRRIGRPVVITIPEPRGEQDKPFISANLNDDGELCVWLDGHFDVLSFGPCVVNGYEIDFERSTG